MHACYSTNKLWRSANLLRPLLPGHGRYWFLLDGDSGSAFLGTQFHGRRAKTRRRGNHHRLVSEPGYSTLANDDTPKILQSLLLCEAVFMHEVLLVGPPIITRDISGISPDRFDVECSAWLIWILERWVVSKESRGGVNGVLDAILSTLAATNPRTYYAFEPVLHEMLSLLLADIQYARYKSRNIIFDSLCDKVLPESTTNIQSERDWAKENRKSTLRRDYIDTGVKRRLIEGMKDGRMWFINHAWLQQSTESMGSSHLEYERVTSCVS
jgi:hypothetical protein